MNRSETIRAQLAVLEPSLVEIEDDSARHAGHAGASGGGHFRLTIVSSRFAGCRTLERQRMVYDALASLLKREIHALSIIAKTPDEYSSSL